MHIYGRVNVVRYINIRIRKTTHDLARELARRTDKKIIDVIDEALRLLKFYYEATGYEEA